MRRKPLESIRQDLKISSLDGRSLLSREKECTLVRRQTFSHEKNLHKKDRRTLNYTHRRLSKGQWGYIKKRGYVYFDISSSCGGDPTRTNDLQVMSLASYQLLHSAMLRCVRDSNPWPPAWQAGILTGWTNAPMFFLWAKMDSNHRRRKPADLQSAPFGHSGICPL